MSKPIFVIALASIGSCWGQTIEYYGRDVPYTVSNGMVIVYGDIIAGRVEDLVGPKAKSAKSNARFAVGYVEPDRGWPKVNGIAEIPYENAAAYPPAEEAIRTFNQIFEGAARLVPRNGQPDYITFRQDTACNSSVGKVGGQQFIGFADYCGPSGMLHEFGHAVGMLHENQHPDREQFMRINWDNATKDPKVRADVQVEPRAQRIGLYNIDSLLNPVLVIPSRNGQQVVQMNPAGIGPDTNRAGTYSEGDLDAIRRLVGAAPTKVTVSSVPVGLNVIVDGATITTPRAFDWAIGSTHTLSVPEGFQKAGGIVSSYGRWNDDTARTHQITVRPGSGGRVDPATSPAITLYSAFFATYNPAVLAANRGSGTGTVRFDPAPVAIPNETVQYLPDGQPTNLVATADAGSNFYGFDTKLVGGAGNFFPISEQANPYPVNGGGNWQYNAKFTKQPVTRIVTDPPGQMVIVDGDTKFTPVIFAPEFDPAWAPGSKHTIDIPPDPQFRNNYNLRRFVFRDWSDGQPQRHEIQAATDQNVTITARFETQYNVNLIANGNRNCAGTFNLVPAAADKFYAAGSRVTVTAIPADGFQVASWGGLTGVTGRNLAQDISVDEEQVAEVQFNLVADPLTITRVTPATLTVGSEDTVVTIDGTGFTDKADALVYVDGAGTFSDPTLVNPNQITLRINKDRMEKAGIVRIVVRNQGTAGTCRVNAEINVPVIAK